MSMSGQINTQIKLCFILILAFLETSCVQNCVDESSLFRVRVELHAAQSGSINLNYTTKESEIFSEKLIVKSFIEKTSDIQFVEFCLDKEPQDLKFIFPKSLSGTKLKILSALFENKDEQLFVTGDRFHFYFMGNEHVKFDNSDNIYVFNQDFYDVTKPYITGRNSIRRLLKNRLIP